MTYGVTGWRGSLLRWGRPDQKARYLPAMARGEIIGCYCLTEPNAGSDAGSLESTSGAGEMSGKLKLLGYEGQELVTVKNP